MVQRKPKFNTIIYSHISFANELQCQWENQRDFDTLHSCTVKKRLDALGINKRESKEYQKIIWLFSITSGMFPILFTPSDNDISLAWKLNIHSFKTERLYCNIITCINHYWKYSFLDICHGPFYLNRANNKYGNLDRSTFLCRNVCDFEHILT